MTIILEFIILEHEYLEEKESATKQLREDHPGKVIKEMWQGGIPIWFV